MAVKSTTRLALAAATALSVIAAGGVAFAATNLVTDGTFSDPDVGTGTLAYAYGAEHVGGISPAGVATATGVTFDGNSGVQGNGSAWGFADAPLGATQTAFLQSYGGGSSDITFDTTTLVSGHSYILSFYDSDRPGYSVNPITVTAGDKSVGTFEPSSTWGLVTETFTAAGGSGLSFSTAALSGDNDAGLFDVTLTAVPEPAAWTLMLLGVGGLGLALRRRRSFAAA